MTWTKIHIEVTTPLFSQGVEGTGAQIRVPSIRGALRYWFRALVGGVIGPDIEPLTKLEGRVFGNTESSSPVKMRIRTQPGTDDTKEPDWCNGSTERIRWMGYLLGLGLSEPVKKPTGSGYDCQLKRPYVLDGEMFTLELKLDLKDDATHLVLAALWLMCAFGGLGARVRRGFGGLRITAVEGPLPEPWTSDTLLTPGLQYYEQLNQFGPEPELLSRCNAPLARLATECGFEQLRFDSDAWGTDLPTYPILSVDHTNIATSQYHGSGWDSVLIYAGEQLRHHRASEPVPGVKYSPKVKTWEWLNVMTGDVKAFNLGALGLPVCFKSNIEVHATGAGGEKLRRASPLWLRAVGSGRHWKLLSFAFQGKFLPDDVAVTLWRDQRPGKVFHISPDDVIDMTDTWIDWLNTGRSFV